MGKLSSILLVLVMATIVGPGLYLVYILLNRAIFSQTLTSVDAAILVAAGAAVVLFVSAGSYFATSDKFSSRVASIVRPAALGE